MRYSVAPNFIPRGRRIWPVSRTADDIGPPRLDLAIKLRNYRIVEREPQNSTDGPPASSKPARRGSAGGRVQSLSRAIGILRSVADARGGIALNILARRVGLAPSTAHRLLTTLKHEGLVQDDGHGLWFVGADAFAIGSAFLRDRNIVDMARPVMQRLMSETKETVNLAVRNDGEALYLSQVECEQIMRAFSRPGSRVPMHSSAVGKALLAHMPTTEVQAILGQRGLSKFTDRTITNADALAADLDGVRERGYAIDDAEHAIGLRCVAAPIFGSDGVPVAALSVSAPAARVPDRRIPELGRAVIRAADEISAASGRQT
jgi:IclR family acetate operon transcriptional repressor